MEHAEDVPVVTFLRDQLAVVRAEAEAAESALASEREAHASTRLALREQERLALSLEADLKAARADLARLRRSLTASERARTRMQEKLDDNKRSGGRRVGLRLPWGERSGG